MEAFVYLVWIAVASFAVLPQPVVAQKAKTTLPLTYPNQVLEGDGMQICPSDGQRGMARNAVKNATRSLLRESVIPLLQLPNNYSCGGTTGWRRVAYLNMSDSSQQCPSVWRDLNMSDPYNRCPSVWQEITTPHRVCGRKSVSTGSCEGLNYTTGSEQYNRVCGRIIGYQIGSPGSFHGEDRLINSYYIDGVSVTRGSPRQHVWSFVGGRDEIGNSTSPEHSANTYTCPCVADSTTDKEIPQFVYQNYFCESGLTRWNGTSGVFWPNGDPLWDGQNCGPTSTCCTDNSPPWFDVTLASSTTDDIEIRICGDNGITNEDTPIQFMELYVKLFEKQ